MLTGTSLVSLVDDDGEVLAATASLLRSLGLEVRTFRSAEEFLDSDQLLATGCLVTDLHMVGMDGLQLQKEMCTLKPDCRVILVTAYPTAPAEKEAIANGACGFFTKPIEVAPFIECVRWCISGAS